FSLAETSCRKGEGATRPDRRPRMASTTSSSNNVKPRSPRAPGSFLGVLIGRVPAGHRKAKYATKRDALAWFLLAIGRNTGRLINEMRLSTKAPGCKGEQVGSEAPCRAGIKGPRPTGYSGTNSCH